MYSSRNLLVYILEAVSNFSLEIARYSQAFQAVNNPQTLEQVHWVHIRTSVIELNKEIVQILKTPGVFGVQEGACSGCW